MDCVVLQLDYGVTIYTMGDLGGQTEMNFDSAALWRFDKHARITANTARWSGRVGRGWSLALSAPGVRGYKYTQGHAAPKQ
jgi:hypothetical protein